MTVALVITVSTALAGALWLLLRFSQYASLPFHRARSVAQQQVSRCRQASLQLAKTLQEIEAASGLLATSLASSKHKALAEIVRPRRTQLLAVEQLRHAHGIGPDTVASLKANGYKSVEQIAQVAQSRLTRIYGIGAAKAARIMTAATDIWRRNDEPEPTENERTRYAAICASLDQSYQQQSAVLAQLREETSRAASSWADAAREQEASLAQVRTATFLSWLAGGKAFETRYREYHATPLPPNLPGIAAPTTIPTSVSSAASAPIKANDAATSATLPVQAPTPSPALQPHAPQHPGAASPNPGLGRFVSVLPGSSGSVATSIPPAPLAQAPEAYLTRQELETRTIRQDSLAYKKAKVVANAPHVPFATYYPTLASMSPRQRKWYFWWRFEWEQGRPLPTDLSYLYVYAYELVNLGYDTDPRSCLAKLKRLHEAYGPVYDKIRHHLPLWMGDLAWEIGADDEAYACYMLGGLSHLARAVRSVAPDDDRLIQFSSQSSYSATAYFRAHRDSMQQFLRQELRTLEDLCQAQLKQGLLQVLNNGQVPKLNSYDHQLYSSAVIDRKVSCRPLQLRGSASANETMALNMGTVVRLLENAHRVVNGENRTLKADTDALPPLVREHLLQLCQDAKSQAPTPHATGKGKPSAAVAPPTRPATPISFDPALVQHLQAENQEISQLLAEVMADKREDVAAAIEPAVPRPQPEAIAPTAGTQPPALPPVPQPAPAVLTTPTGPGDWSALFAGGSGSFGDFWAELNPRYRFILSLFHQENVVSHEQAVQAAKQRGLMLAAVVDEINEVAAETLGDALIEEGEDAISIVPDYRDDLLQAIQSEEG